MIMLAACFAQCSAQTFADTSHALASKIPPLLKASDGRAIRTIKQWEDIRRPGILRLFEDNIYGANPPKFDKITFTVTRLDPVAMRGKATLKEVAIAVTRKQQQIVIHLILFTPNNRKKAPAFLLINNRGIKNTDPTRQIKSAFWPAEMVIDSGYAIAAFQNSDAAPDDKERYAQGMLRLYPETLLADNGIKAIGAWAWAASRVMDYLVTDKAVDAERIAIVGHSRGGKTALWTGAIDKRFALVFASCSGCTGAALARHKFGESIKSINTVFPHWFCTNYKKYNDHVDALPVDQHMLIALIAPRPVYTTNATRDLWADPSGSYLSLIYAKPVYDLYHLRCSLPPQPPAVEKPIIKSAIGYHIRKGVHDMTLYDWKNFIRFANYHYYHR